MNAHEGTEFAKAWRDLVAARKAYITNGQQPDLQLSHDLTERLTAMADNVLGEPETYSSDWVRVELMLSPDGRQMHAISGDREEGVGDVPYIGLELIKAEKSRRVYYQEQIYAVAKFIDERIGGSTVTGTADTPGSNVIARLLSLTQESAEPEGESQDVN